MNYFNVSSQEVNKVYKTNDLSIFKQIKGNRPPNPQHIRRLADSFKINGTLQNPIIVNNKLEVIDGQHRLLAAKQAKTFVYYIMVDNYKLEEVQVLNLNQKNWTKRDFMEGYADMGIESYVNLRAFVKKNKDFNMSDCIALCQNTAGSSSSMMSQKYRSGQSKVYNTKEVFEEGTWLGRDFKVAQEYADRLRMIKPYYDGYRRSTFVIAMVGLFKNENFDFFEFLRKIKNNPNSLDDCSNVAQYKMLIEDIYNYKKRDKVSLRF